MEISADQVRGQTDMGPAARIPPWSATARGVFEGGWWTGILEVRTVASQNRIASFEIPTDGYILLNSSLVVRPMASNRDFKIFLEGRNLTGEDAREHASFLKDVAPLPARSLRVGVGYSF